ncbi:hypothetical protein KCU77_g1526, partial [Aureobasidium melanogenum]
SVLLLPAISIIRVSILLFYSSSLKLIRFEMQKSSSLLIKYGGSGLSSIPQSFSKTVQNDEKVVEATYPKVTEGKIQGSTPHKSSKDKSDEKEVITVSYHTSSGTRVTSVHAHDDGTWKEFPSRNAFRGK